MMAYYCSVVQLLCLLTIVVITSATVRMQQSDLTCDSLEGVWEVSRPHQNYSEYYRINEDGQYLFFESHWDRNIGFGDVYESAEFKTAIKTNKFEFSRNVVDLQDDCTFSRKDGTVWRRVADVRKVQVIFMNHLDVGYNTNQHYPGTNDLIPGYVFNVLNWYFQIYFPRAARLADELREIRAEETFIYTTHPWLVSLYLDCPDLTLSGIKLECPSEEQLEIFRRAVWMGDITWHAGPLNQEAEASNPELFSYSLTLSEKMDAYFRIKREAKTLSQRDVPGMTRSVIPYILQHGIAAISVGSNPWSSPPDVPSPNVWKFGDHKILTYWHKGGYPRPTGTSPENPGGLRRSDCQFVQGLDEVLCFAFRADNLGPPVNVLEIKTDYQILRYEFPGAEIAATKFEDFTKLMLPLMDTFPVVDAEIGDTWIQGAASDPVKMIKFRAIKRLRSQCVSHRQCSADDKRFDDFSRLLLKLPEHTYGLASCRDNIHWSNEQFLPLQYTQLSFRNNSVNFLGQRAFNDMAVDALKDHPLAGQIKKEFENLKPYLPDLTSYRLQDLSTVINCSNGIVFRIGRHGGLVDLIDPRGVNWASESTPLAKVMYRTYSQDDYTRTNDQYGYGAHSPFYKLGYERADPESKYWDVEAHGVYVPIQGDRCSQGVFVRLVHTNETTWWKYGAPTEYFLKYTVGDDGVDIDYQFFNKPSTKMVEALFLSFETPERANHEWYLHKLGYWIDPTNVVNNGSQYVHGVDFGVGFLDSERSGLMIESPDVATVSVLTRDRMADVLPVPLTPMRAKPNGIAFNIFNNVWDTNYIFWYPFQPQDKHYKARFRMSFN